jgi:hypothetical protein
MPNLSGHPSIVLVKTLLLGRVISDGLLYLWYITNQLVNPVWKFPEAREGFLILGGGRSSPPKIRNKISLPGKNRHIGLAKRSELMTTLPHPTNFEYRSKEDINGWPIIHINIGTDPETGRPLVAKGVVAIGNIAVGVVSIGVVAFGVVALADFGLGVISLAAFAIGIVAFGAVALGFEYALGAVALSANIAIGAIEFSPNVVEWARWVPLQIAKMPRLLMNM